MQRFFSVRRMSLMGLFVALQIVLARYVGYQVSSTLRLSLENVPVILAAAWLGPLSGALVGALADILGMLIQGSSGVYFPPLTVTPVLLGLIVGFAFRRISPKRQWLGLGLSVVMGELVANLLYMSLALVWYNDVILHTHIPFWVLLSGRAPMKLVILALDTVVCCLLHQAVYHRVVKKAVDYEL